MKLFVFAFILINSGATDTTDIVRIRSLFSEALTNESKSKELISYIEKVTITPVVAGYKGAAIMLLSKFSWNPFYKYKYFNDGKAILEESIENDPSSAELRYLRFAFQTNAPSFLGYNTSIEKDKIYLIDAVKNISDSKLRDNIINLLKNSKYVDECEKQKF